MGSYCLLLLSRIGPDNGEKILYTSARVEVLIISVGGVKIKSVGMDGRVISQNYGGNDGTVGMGGGVVVVSGDCGVHSTAYKDAKLKMSCELVSSITSTF